VALFCNPAAGGPEKGMARGGGLYNLETGQAAFKLEVKKRGARPVVLPTSQTKTGETWDIPGPT
jgi:hypothetical protein